MRYNTRKATIPSDGGSLKLLILSPKGTTAQKRPGVLWIHGGGYVVGMPGMVHMSRARSLVIKYGAIVVSPEYRLAGQAPYPAALEDCHCALMYLKEHADELAYALTRSWWAAKARVEGWRRRYACMRRILAA